MKKKHAVVKKTPSKKKIAVKPEGKPEVKPEPSFAISLQFMSGVSKNLILSNMPISNMLLKETGQLFIFDSLQKFPETGLLFVYKEQPSAMIDIQQEDSPDGAS